MAMTLGPRGKYNLSLYKTDRTHVFSFSVSQCGSQNDHKQPTNLHFSERDFPSVELFYGSLLVLLFR